jgi:hypothetical protein
VWNGQIKKEQHVFKSGTLYWTACQQLAASKRENRMKRLMETAAVISKYDKERNTIPHEKDNGVEGGGFTK